jgi:hypothetical protein
MWNGYLQYCSHLQRFDTFVHRRRGYFYGRKTAPEGVYLLPRTGRKVWKYRSGEGGDQTIQDFNLKIISIETSTRDEMTKYICDDSVNTFLDNTSTKELWF